MIAVAAFLALAVAASPTSPPRRTGLPTSNSARARMGLLPRKPARTRADRRERRLLTIGTPAPTYLAEPAPLAEGAPGGELEAAVGVAPAAGGAELADRGAGLVAARGPVETVRLPSAGAPDARAGGGPPAIEPPEEVGALRFAALGVETEVTLRMRLDP
ncbi:MAG TPA: hypothetical protein VF841_09625 [Anaeromyxobacter sp.]